MVSAGGDSDLDKWFQNQAMLEDQSKNVSIQIPGILP